MAAFIQKIRKEKIGVDAVFFNAQYARNSGYKKMAQNEQIRVFDRVLQKIETLYKPDIIAIACNTLSVVYQHTNFKKYAKTPVLDIIDTGKKLIAASSLSQIIEIAMPTTVQSGIYKNPSKKHTGIASDTQLPDAIENNYTEAIDTYLERIFKQVPDTIIRNKQPVALFLGCTHFPLIADLFLAKARLSGIDVHELLNPNTAFSLAVFHKLTAQYGQNLRRHPINVQVVSRMRFQETEIINMAALIESYDPESAQALRHYHYKASLF